MRDAPTPARSRAVQHQQPQLIALFACDSLSSPIRGSFSRFLLGASAAEVIRQAVISLVTRELKYRTLGLHHGELGFPGLCPCCRIFNREFVEDGVIVDACEA